MKILLIQNNCETYPSLEIGRCYIKILIFCSFLEIEISCYPKLILPYDNHLFKQSIWHSFQQKVICSLVSLKSPSLLFVSFIPRLSFSCTIKIFFKIVLKYLNHHDGLIHSFPIGIWICDLEFTLKEKYISKSDMFWPGYIRVNLGKVGEKNVSD